MREYFFFEERQSRFIPQFKECIIIEKYAKNSTGFSSFEEVTSK